MWSRWPLVKNELADIDCDSHERHRDSSLAGDRDGGSAHAGRFYSQSRITASKSRKRTRQRSGPQEVGQLYGTDCGSKVDLWLSDGGRHGIA